MTKARLMAVVIIGMLLLSALMPGSGAVASLEDPPGKPINFSPDNATTEISPMHTFSIMYTSSDNIDYMQWQILEADSVPAVEADGSYGKPSWDSGLVAATGADLLTYGYPVGLLEYGKTYWWHVRVQDETGAWSPWSDQTCFQVIDNLPPNQPENTSPANEETGVSVPVTLVASSFSDPNTTGYAELDDAQGAAQWQIRSSTGSYSSPVFSSGYNANTIAFSAATKKITDSANGLAIFKTGDTIVVTGSTFNNSVYTVAKGNVSGEIVVSESLTNESAGDPVSISLQTASLTSIIVPTNRLETEKRLEAGTTYYWHVRYRDNYDDYDGNEEEHWSAYSEETSLTTAPPSLPVAAFSADVTEAIAGEQAVTFTDASTPAGEIVAWHWDFGDGNTEDWDTLSRPLSGKTSHLYADGGTYTVSLTVTDTSDTTDAESKTAYVVVHAKPRSVFASVKTAKTKQEITFTDSSTGDITQWVWDFGDGTSEQWTTATRPADGKVEHAFKKKGTYIVSLEVIGPLGSDTKNTQIEVSGAGGFHFGLWMIGVAVAVIVVIAAGVYLLRARRAK